MKRFSTPGIFWLVFFQRAAKYLVLVCTALGIALVLTWRWGHEPDALILLALVWVVGTAVFFIVAGVIIDCAILVQHRNHTPQQRAIDPALPSEEMPGNVRQKILLKRLDVDELRHCSQSGQACSMWSLCGSVKDEECADAGDMTPEKRRVVQRNVANCHYPKAVDNPPQDK